MIHIIMLKNYRKHDNLQNYLHIIAETIDVQDRKPTN